MNNAQIIGYPLLIIAALELFLGLLIIRKNPRNSPTNRSAAAVAFAAAAWSFSAALMYIRLSKGLDYNLFVRLCWVGWFTVPTTLQTVLFLGDEQSRKARVVGLVLYPYWLAVLAICLFTDLIVTGSYIPLPYRNSPGPLEMPARIIGSLMAFWVIYETVRLRRRVTGYRRSQLSYYLSGTIIFGIGGAVIGGVIQVFTGQGIEPSLSAFFSLPWILTIFYAITRYRLFDIRLVLSRTIAILLLSFCISALQFLLFKLMEPVVGAVASIFISVPIIGVLFFGTPLSGNVQQWINDFVLGDRYLYQEMLKQSANAMITILDRDELLRYIIENVRTFIGVKEVLLFVRGRDGSYSTRQCGGENEATDSGCVLPHVIVHHLASRNSPIVAEELSSASAAGSKDLLESVVRVGADIVLPLVSKGQLLGVLTLGQRINGVPYLPSDIETLRTLASHAAVAIENSELFEDAIRSKALQRESEYVFRSLAETTTAAIFILRADKIIYANRASSRMSGYSIEELLSMNPWSIIHPAFRDSMIERGLSWIKGRPVQPQFEFKFITKQGEERWALTTSASIELQGAPAILSTMVDVTDIKRTEEERELLYTLNEQHYRERIAEQERFSAILSATNDGFWIANEELRLVFVNDAYCRMSGYGREELLSMSIADVEAAESPEIVRKHTDSILERGYDRFETRHRRKGGSLIDVEVLVNRVGRDKTVCAFIRDISQRKKDEIEKAQLYEENERYLRERIAEQERFRAVLSTTSDGFWIVNVQNRLVFVNDAYCRMSGYGREELLSMSIADIEAQENPDVIRRHSEEIRDRGNDRFETKHRRKDGSIIDLEVTANRFGKTGEVFSFHRDISERKKNELERARLNELNMRYLEDRLAEQERLGAVLKTTSDGFCIVNDDLFFQYANDAWCAMLGYRREELLSMNMTDIDVKLSRDEVMDALAVVRDRGHGLVETRHRRKDGTVIDVEIFVNRFRHEHVFFAFLRDITARKKAEAERVRLYEENERHLRDRIREQKRFAAVLDTTNDGFWICDADTRFTYVNDAYCRMLGYRREELLSLYIKDVEANEDDEMVAARSRKIAQQGHDVFETRHRRKDGSVIDLEITVNLSPYGNMYFAFGRDITERKKAEAEKARYQAEREKILKDLHDGIGGLTTNINLLAEIAQTRDDLGEVRRSLATIAALSRESLSEIRTFLQSLDVKDLTWHAVAAELRHLGSTIIESHGIGFTLTTSLPDDASGPSSVAAMNLFRIYKESLTNIVKHARASAVEVSFTREGTNVMLEVRDNGVGLRKDRGRGRGLLNMEARAAELGGTLAVSARSGRGTTVALAVPL